MATLNTLRTKMGWLLMVVIGLALLAFLLGDLSDSGSMLLNRKKMQVGEVAGETIGYDEFSGRMEYYKSIRQMMGGSDNLSEADLESVKNEAWQNIISETVIEPNYTDLGLTVSETEQIDMVNGTFLSPVVVQMFTNPQTGTYDATFLKNFVSNIPNDPTGGADMLWQYIKKNMNQERVSSKYMDLVNKGMYVTDAQVEQSLADNAKNFNISYVVDRYASIADSTMTISNSEIKAYYNSHRNNFRRSAVRDVEYVVFEILPSADDMTQAAKDIDVMAAEFVASETPMQYAQLNSHSTPDARYYKESELTGNMAIMAAEGDRTAIDGPSLQATTYTMTRIADVKMIPDSVGAKHILLSMGQTERADSIITAIKAGASFAELSSQYSMDQAAATRGGDLGNFAPEQMVPEFADAVVASKVNDIFTVETQFGLHVVQTTYKSAPVEKTQFATVVYEVEPSSFTDQSIYSAATTFSEKAAGSSANFSAAVNEESLSKRVARIRSTDTDANGLEDSRELVRWAYTQEVGDVSSIMKIGESYVVASLTSAQEDGFAPVEKVAPEIAPMVRIEKKAELIKAKMVGATLADVASAVGSEVEPIEGVTFGSYFLEGLGMEPALNGAVTAAKQGQLSKPVVGNAGVYMFVVDSAADVEGTTARDEKVRLQAMAQAYVSDRVMQALMLNSDIKDYRVKFF